MDISRHHALSRKVPNPFPAPGLQGFQVGGDEGYGHQLMDRMVEEGFYLQRINNGSPAKRSDIYTNIFSECWSIVGQLIERRAVIGLLSWVWHIRRAYQTCEFFRSSGVDAVT